MFIPLLAWVNSQAKTKGSNNTIASDRASKFYNIYPGISKHSKLMTYKVPIIRPLTTYTSLMTQDPAALQGSFSMETSQ